MKLLKFTFKNFLSFEEGSVDFSNKGLTLIMGENYDIEYGSSNGSGKSAIFDSVVWCLFDSTCRGIASDSVVRANSNSGCSVTGEIQIDEKIYTITRYRKHSKHGNTVKLFCGKDDISGMTVKDTQEKIERLIGMSYKTFVTSCMFGQNLMDLFSRATDKERKEILESVVDTKDYSEVLQITRDSIRKLKFKVAEYQHALDVVQAQIGSKMSSAKSFEQSIKEAAQRAEDQRAQIQSQIKKIEMSVSKEDLDGALGQAQERAMLLQDAVSKDTGSEQAAQDALADIIKVQGDSRVKVLGMERNIKETEKRISNIHGLGSACPTCEQGIPDSHKGKIETELKENLADLTEILAEHYEEHSRLTNAYDAAKINVEEVQARERKLRSDFFNAGKEVGIIKESISIRNRSKKDIELLETKMTIIASDTSSYEESLNTIYKEIDELKIKIPEIEDQIQSASMLIPYLEYWETAFGDTGIRSFLFDSCMPILNERANYYSQELTSGSIQLEFSSQSALKSGKVRDKIAFSAVNSYGASAYDGNSGGEKRRIDVCVMLALQYLMRHNSKVTCNALFFDEVFDNLDAEGCVKVLEILARELDESALESIFVISHNDSLKSLFLNRIIVSKKNGISKIIDSNLAGGSNGEAEDGEKQTW